MLTPTGTANRRCSPTLIVARLQPRPSRQPLRGACGDLDRRGRRADAMACRLRRECPFRLTREKAVRAEDPVRIVQVRNRLTLAHVSVRWRLPSHQAARSPPRCPPQHSSRFFFCDFDRMFRFVDADPVAVEFVGRDQGCPGAAEAIEHQVLLVRRRVNDQLQHVEVLFGGIARVLRVFEFPDVLHLLAGHLIEIDLFSRHARTMTIR